MRQNKEYPYLYLDSVSEARQNNELDRWRESHRLNIACREAIEEAIRTGFDGMHLDRNCAKGVIETYGCKRVGWVLANTLQQKKGDGRFHPRNREWAETIFIPRSNRNYDFAVQSHPAVLDGFVDEFRQAMAAMNLFDRSHCTSLSGQDLEGRVLVLHPMTLKESCWSPENQLWLADGGFGCSPTAVGRAIYATCLGDGEHTRWDRGDFLGILKEEFLPDWARESLGQLLQEQSTPTAPDRAILSM